MDFIFCECFIYTASMESTGSKSKKEKKKQQQQKQNKNNNYNKYKFEHQCLIVSPRLLLNLLLAYFMAHTVALS